MWTLQSILFQCNYKSKVTLEISTRKASPFPSWLSAHSCEKAVLKAYYDCQGDKDVQPECDCSAWLLPVACFSEGRFDCPWRPTAYCITWTILGDTVTKCPSWVLHTPVRLYMSVWDCWHAYNLLYYLWKETKDMYHVVWSCQSLTKERQKGREEGQDKTEWKRVQKLWSVRKLCICALSHWVWTGQQAREPLHASLWQLTLITPADNTTTILTPHLWNADYIITHHTHFNSCCCRFCLQCIKQINKACRFTFECWVLLDSL